MKEINSYQEFNVWRRTAKPGERVIYCCARPVLDRDIAIENAILDARDVKVSGLGHFVLTKKHIRGRGRGKSRPQRQTPYPHISSESSIGVRASWKHRPRIDALKSEQLFETFRQEIEGPITDSRADRAVWDHIAGYFRK
jgi:hypothetical protein